MSDRFGGTRTFQTQSGEIADAHDVIMSVYNALEAKGYSPITQIVGYLISGDPTYITSYNNARSMIKRIERDDLLEELVGFYVNASDNRR